jgi:putative membrane-bound dehydrogenase-like protein
MFVFGASAAEVAHPVADHTNSELHPALEISLFAREPDIVDPVALTFDENGRMYVVEMRDYPYGFEPNRRPGGTIRLLEDTDGDARADRSVLFADNLSFPTSICPWKGGVLVAAPPEIIFLKDTDGDGKADVREVLLKGFTLGVTDSNMNGVRWGLDNRVHGLNGGNSGSITSFRKSGPPVALGNLDFSFDPETGDFATTFHASGGFGLVFDDWGRSFVTYNINHLQQRILPERYLRRFPGFPPVNATESISDHGEMASIYPISVAGTRPNHPEQSGHFSSAGGMGYVGWRGYGEDLPGSLLVCDVVGNLVHRDLLKENGPVFTAIRAPTELTREFFASRDSSFRPVGVELGPDNALYLIDMQRDVIEHPDYIPEKVRAKLNLRAGEDRGRIYRLTPKGGLPTWKPNLHDASAPALVNELSHPNQWRRATAQRLLVERQNKRAVGSLKKLARSGNDPLGRLHALWTLSGLRALDEATVERALTDTHPGIRENALLLAEFLLPESKRLTARILAMAADPATRVRFQAALTIGQLDHPSVLEALRSILMTDYQHRWTRVAVLSSLRSGADDLFVSLLGNEPFCKELTPPKSELFRELADLTTARGGPKGLSSVLRAIAGSNAGEPLKLAALEGVQSGIGRSETLLNPGADDAVALSRLSTNASSVLLAAAWTTSRALGLPENESQRKALGEAIQRVTEKDRAVASRVADLKVVSLGGYPAVKETLFSLLEGTQPSIVQDEVIAALRQFKEPEVAQRLVERWRSLAPGVRVPVLDLLLQRLSFHPYLLEAMETGKITVGELNLDLEQRRRLLWKSSPDIKIRAAKLIDDGEYGNRKAVVEEWLQNLPANGNAQRGKAGFEKTCAQCHAAGGVGNHVGPDLTAVSHRSVEDLLSNILDPNMAIQPNYVTYSCETDSGELETGILQSESAEAITLLQAAEKKVVVPRKRIKRLESTGLSLMPEGLEAGMTPADMRDLIAFLQQKR